MFYKEVRYWSFIIVASYLPVIIVELVERVLWYHTTISPGYIIFIDGIFTIGFFPMYLFWINYSAAKKQNIKTSSFIINSLIILHCIWIAADMCRASYGDSRGVVADPEGFAFARNTVEWALATFVSILWIIAAFQNLKWRKPKTQ